MDVLVDVEFRLCACVWWEVDTERRGGSGDIGADRSSGCSGSGSDIRSVDGSVGDGATKTKNI